MAVTKRITLALTGASGAAYGIRLLECLLAADYRVYLLLSDAARVVIATELGEEWPADADACARWLERRFAAAEAPVPTRVFHDLAALVEHLATEAKSGDQILVMSNGSFGGIHSKLLERLQTTHAHEQVVL